MIALVVFIGLMAWLHGYMTGVAHMRQEAIKLVRDLMIRSRGLN